MGDHERTLKIEYVDNSMKTKTILTSFGETFGTLKFDETSHHFGITHPLMQFIPIPWCIQ